MRNLETFTKACVKISSSTHFRIVYYFLVFRQTGQQRIDDTMWQKYRWYNMASSVYKAMSSCQCCIKNATLPKPKRHLQIFPAVGSLEFGTIIILPTLSKTMIGNLHVFTITDKNSEPTKAAPIAKKTATTVVCISFRDSVLHTITTTHWQRHQSF